MSDLLTSTTPKARIPHACGQCSRSITPGERYARHVYACDGAIEAYCTCIQCQRLGRDLLDAGVFGEDEYGCLTHPYLPDVDWADVRSWSRLWEIRADMYQARWTKDDGTVDVYPTPIEEAP